MFNLCSASAGARQKVDVDEVDYVEEGRKLLEAVNLGSSSAPARYSPCDPLWKHPSTGATLYVGNAVTASNRSTLRDLGITRIVNCQDVDGKDYFDGDPELQYLRFSIGLWRSVPSVRDGGKGTWQFWEPYFKFITESLRDGHNVLVHCLAGAHRAGTAGIAALMFLCNWDVKTAIPAAQRLRSAIQPIGGFPELLAKLEQARVGREERYRKMLGCEVEGEIDRGPKCSEPQRIVEPAMSAAAPPMRSPNAATEAVTNSSGKLQANRSGYQEDGGDLDAMLNSKEWGVKA